MSKIKNAFPAMLRRTPLKILLPSGCLLILGIAQSLAKSPELPPIALPQDASRPAEKNASKDFFEITLRVQPQNPQATDKNPQGKFPFKSIQAALNAALIHAQNGRSVQVDIHPGIYRESLKLDGAPKLIKGKKSPPRGTKIPTNAAIKLRAFPKGKIILKGTQALSGWKINRHGTFELNRTLNKYPKMLFVEGTRLVRVDHPRKIFGGSFYAGNQSIELLPPKGARVTNATVEVSRDEAYGIRIRNLQNITLENFHVQQGYQTGIDIQGAKNIRLRAVRSNYNSQTGLHVSNTQGLQLEHCTLNLNGEHGAIFRSVWKIRIKGLDIQRNGWKWIETPNREQILEPTAFELMGCKDFKAESLRAFENRGTGILIHWPHGEFQFENLASIGNNGAGIEVTQNPKTSGTGKALHYGPRLHINASQIAFNAAAGVKAHNLKVKLSNSILYGNGQNSKQPQIAAYGPQAKKKVTYKGHSSMRLHLESNIIESISQGQLIQIDTLTHYKGNGNLFYDPKPKAFRFGDKSLLFSQWQSTAGEDLNSLRAKPKLSDPRQFEFSPKADSPWFQRANWPKRELKGK